MRHRFDASEQSLCVVTVVYLTDVYILVCVGTGIDVGVGIGIAQKHGIKLIVIHHLFIGQVLHRLQYGRRPRILTGYHHVTAHDGALIVGHIRIDRLLNGIQREIGRQRQHHRQQKQHRIQPVSPPTARKSKVWEGLAKSIYIR